MPVEIIALGTDDNYCCRDVTENDAFATGEAVKKYSVLEQILEARVCPVLL